MRLCFSLFVLFALCAPARSGRLCRLGDPVEMKIGGVPTEEQTQVNNIYTVDANGMVNMPYINKVRAEGLTPAQLASSIEDSYRAAQDFHEPDHHDRDAAAGAFRERRRRGPRTHARSFHRRHDSARRDQRRRRLQRFRRSETGSPAARKRGESLRRPPDSGAIRASIRSFSPGDRVEVPQSFF